MGKNRNFDDISSYEASDSTKAKMLRKPEEALINEWLSEKAGV